MSSSDSLTRSRRSKAASTLTLLLALVFARGEVIGESPNGIATPELAPLAPFVGKTWKGLVNADKQLYDVARWEVALAGRAVRITHSVDDGMYGGETFVTWDRAREQLVYFYFTTAGFYTQGLMESTGAGRLVSREQVSGNEGGITEVEAVQELLPDGRLRVSTRMLRSGVWEDRGEVFYAVDPDAEVVLPATAN